VAKKHGNTFIQSSCTASTAAALGIVNGRFGGEAGVVEKWGVPLDGAVAVLGHLGGFGFSYADDRENPRFDLLSEVLHTVGDTGLASAIFRFFHKVGAQHACGRGRRSRCPRERRERGHRLHGRASGEVTRSFSGARA